MIVSSGSDHCPAMKGIETRAARRRVGRGLRSDHCPAMKGIETITSQQTLRPIVVRSDHCPAMKGIETCNDVPEALNQRPEATTAPQ